MKLRRRLKLSRAAALCAALMLTLSTHYAAAQTPTATPPLARTEPLKETLQGVEIEDPAGVNVRDYTGQYHPR